MDETKATIQNLHDATLIAAGALAFNGATDEQRVAYLNAATARLKASLTDDVAEAVGESISCAMMTAIGVDDRADRVDLGLMLRTIHAALAVFYELSPVNQIAVLSRFMSPTDAQSVVVLLIAGRVGERSREGWPMSEVKP